jgi:hypothetical protein
VKVGIVKAREGHYDEEEEDEEKGGEETGDVEEEDSWSDQFEQFVKIIFPYRHPTSNTTTNTDIQPGTSSNDVTRDQWNEIFEYPEARDRFLQRLDEQRSYGTCLSSELAYDQLVIAMEACLSYCTTSTRIYDYSHQTIIDDAMSAMRILNMANTFYILQTTDHSIITANTNTNTTDTTTTTSAKLKKYIQGDPRLKLHPIWRLTGFWEAALKEGIFLELEKMKPPLAWEELVPEALKELVLALHNLIFGQVATLALTMIEHSGLTREEVIYTMHSYQVWSLYVSMYFLGGSTCITYVKNIPISRRSRIYFTTKCITNTN